MNFLWNWLWPKEAVTPKDNQREQLLAEIVAGVTLRQTLKKIPIPRYKIALKNRWDPLIAD